MNYNNNKKLIKNNLFHTKKTIAFFSPEIELISFYKNVTLLIILIIIMIWIIWSCTKVNNEYKKFLISLIITITDEHIIQSGISKDSFSNFISFLEKVKIKFNIFGITVNRKLWFLFTGFIALFLLVVLQQYLLILPSNSSY